MRAAALLVVVAGCFSKPDPPGGGGGTYGGAPRRLAVGGSHACFISDNGVMYCWGDNARGQLGTDPNTTPFSPTPIAVVQAGNEIDGWTDVAAGEQHTCGILNGSVVCFGLDDNHQVQGGGIATTRLPSGDAVRVFAGGYGTCAIDRAGALYCWGLVDYVAGYFAMPTQVKPASVAAPWAQVSIAPDHTCALRADFGSVWCWGRNDYSDLGSTDPSSARAEEAVAVQGGSYHTIAIANALSCGTEVTGSLACWGAITNGGSPYTLVDDFANTQHHWTAVATQLAHTCGIESGAVRCYGVGESGELGTGDFQDKDAPGPAVWSAATEVGVGDQLSCEFDGHEVRCWGANIYGELGNGEVATVRDPVHIPLSPNAVSLSAGYGHTCALLGDGNVSCWGDNRANQVAFGAGPVVTTPMHARGGIAMISTGAALASGARHNCAIDDTPRTTVVCWGDNTSDQAPPQVTLGSSVVALAAGGGTSCAVSGGQAYCWGQVPADQVSTFHPVTGATNAVDVAVGDGFAGVIDGSGPYTFFEWGTECSLGASTVPEPNAANTVVDTRVVALSQGGEGHGCGAKAQDVECWGGNDVAQVTSQPGSCVTQPLPVPPPTGEAWATMPSIAVAADHSCALTQSAKIYCWGDNTEHALGGDVPALVAQPALVGVAAGVNWNTIVAGPRHMCALANPNNDVYCWGLNRYGEVGNGRSFSAAPGNAISFP